MSKDERKANRRAKIKSLKSAAKKVASKTPAGLAVGAAKKMAPKAKKLANAVRDKAGATKKTISSKVKTAGSKLKAAAKAFKDTPAVAMYDKKGAGMYGGQKMGPGMYGKGSKISYGNYHKPTYQKGSAGQGNSPFGMNTAQKIHKHMKGRK